MSEIERAVLSRDFEQLRTLLASDVNQRTLRGSALGTKVSALFYAAWQNLPSVVEFLARELYADVDCRDDDDRTPLHAACREGHDEVVSALLALGCNSNVADSHSFTRIYQRRLCQRLVEVTMLVSRGLVVVCQGRLFTTNMCLRRLGASEDIQLCILRGDEVETFFARERRASEGTRRCCGWSRSCSSAGRARCGAR
jgi:hypothetical protein